MTQPHRRVPSREEALERLQTAAAIDLADFAALTGTAISLLYKLANQEDTKPGSFPVTIRRIGQRWIIPTAGVREFLCVTAA